MSTEAKVNAGRWETRCPGCGSAIKASRRQGDKLSVICFNGHETPVIRMHKYVGVNGVGFIPVDNRRKVR